MKITFKSRKNHSYIGQLFSWIVAIALVTILSMVYIWHQVETRELMREILHLERQKEVMEKGNVYLHVRIVRLHEQHRVEAVAMNRFDLDHPAIGQVVTIETLGVPAALTNNEPDVRAIAGKSSDRSLILASYPVGLVTTR